MSFANKGSKTLCVDIIESVMDELRRERKIRMVIADADIEEYKAQIAFLEQELASSKDKPDN